MVAVRELPRTHPFPQIRTALSPSDCGKTPASAFDPAEIHHGRHAEAPPSVVVSLLPLIVVILVNLAMNLFVLPRLDTSFLAEERMGRNFAFRGGWCLGGGGGARCNNLHSGRAKLPVPAFAARKHGCWGDRRESIFRAVRWSVRQRRQCCLASRYRPTPSQ